MEKIQKECQKYNLMNCIKKIFLKYELGFEKINLDREIFNYYKDNINDFSYEFTIYHKKKEIGFFEFSIQNKTMFIEIVQIENFKGKNDLPFKIYRLLLINFICAHSENINKIFLNAQSTEETSFCLLCMYQKMGLIPKQQQMKIDRKGKFGVIEMESDIDKMWGKFKEDLDFIRKECK